MIRLDTLFYIATILSKASLHALMRHFILRYTVNFTINFTVQSYLSTVTPSISTIGLQSHLFTEPTDFIVKITSIQSVDI